MLPLESCCQKRAILPTISASIMCSSLVQQHADYIVLDCKQHSTPNFEQLPLKAHLNVLHAFLLEYEDKICLVFFITDVKLEVEKQRSTC